MQKYVYYVYYGHWYAQKSSFLMIVLFKSETTMEWNGKTYQELQKFMISFHYSTQRKQQVKQKM